ncbi:MAG TPA: hypothetical protein VM779_02235 [Thermoanaerobaculia bacterium]|nr:hypothetical protein [Thermoanaerobaculia bacterium]
MIQLRIAVDETFAAEHGDNLHRFLDEVVAIHNIEWRRVRDERFTIAGVEVEPSAGTRDASWLLANLLHRTVQEPDTIHVRITGKQLEIYSSGNSARAIGGLAYRGSDVVVISAAAGVTSELAAYYFFHEIGHCFDAFDLPFGGGHSTFGAKRFATFAVDAGNAQIIEDSDGPHPRDTPLLGPSFIRARLAAARAATRNPALYGLLHDLLLHEPSRANREYEEKRTALLDQAGAERTRIAAFLSRYEITPQQIRADAEGRAHFAQRYWIANDAIARGDLETAREALAEIHSMHELHDGDARRLIAAVGKKVRRSR